MTTLGLPGPGREDVGIGFGFGFGFVNVGRKDGGI
jgi:hypothetical protein